MRLTRHLRQIEESPVSSQKLPCPTVVLLKFDVYLCACECACNLGERGHARVWQTGSSRRARVPLQGATACTRDFCVLPAACTWGVPPGIEQSPGATAASRLFSSLAAAAAAVAAASRLLTLYLCSPPLVLLFLFFLVSRRSQTWRPLGSARPVCRKTPTPSADSGHLDRMKKQHLPRRQCLLRFGEAGTGPALPGSGVD